MLDDPALGLPHWTADNPPPASTGFPAEYASLDGDEVEDPPLACADFAVEDPPLGSADFAVSLDRPDFAVSLGSAGFVLEDAPLDSAGVGDLPLG